MIHYLTDTHCHLDFPVFEQDRLQILEHCRAENINAIVVPGVTAEHWSRVLSLCSTQHAGKPNLYPALGLHPCFLQQHHPDHLQQLRQQCKTGHLSAIGEIGLDFYIKTLDRGQQRYYFTGQLEIANEYNLPVLIHARKSHEEVIRHLKSYPDINGIIHAFSGSYEQAREFLKLDFKLGFGGAYTYPGAKKLRSLVKQLPLDAWVLETDAPDMSPLLHHQQRNSPEYLPEIASEFFLLAESTFSKEQIIAQLEMNTGFIFPSIRGNSGFTGNNKNVSL